jgi:hypothetical protein
VDGVPPDVQPIVNEVARELGAQQSHNVTHVLVTWDDLAVEDRPRDHCRHYAVRRQCEIFPHKYARAGLPVDVEDLRIGTTIITTVSHPVRESLSLNSLVERASILNPSFEVEFCEPFFTDNDFGEGVRRDRAAAIIRDPEAIASFSFDSLSVFLATRLVGLQGASYVTLVVASRIEDGPTVVAGAFKLFGDTAEISTARRDPVRAFLMLIDRYGAEVELCGLRDSSFLR